MVFHTFLFDHDDTLLPTFELRARVLDAAAREVLGRGLDAEAVLGASHGRSLEQMSGDIVGGDDTLARRLVSAYRARYYEANRSGLAPYPGVPELLAGLRARGCRVAVVTSKLGRGARDELERSGLAIHVECLVGAEDVTHPKPDPEPLLKAMGTLGVSPRGTVMVGDTSADLLGARAAGTASIAALWGARDADALLALEPDYAVNVPGAVLTLA